MDVQTAADVFVRPPDQIPQAAIDAGKDAARQAGRQALQELEAGIGVPIPTSPAGARKLVEQEAEKVFKEKLQEILANANLPPIDIRIPSGELTVEGVAALAYATGRAYLETTVRSYTGIPLQLPRRITLKELERTVDALIPDDAAEALELAIMVGAQYAASAITAALVGAGIGSTIPGIGTVVGIAVALTINALREAFKEVKPHQRECVTPISVDIPVNLDALHLLPWLASRRLEVSDLLAVERNWKYCGVGLIVTFDAYLGTVFRELEPVVRMSTAVLGPYQIQEVLQTYNAAPRGLWHFNANTHKIEWIAEDDDFGAITRITKLLQGRVMTCAALQQRAARVEQLPANELAPLRWDLVTELQNAAQQVMFTQSDAALRWFGELAGYLERLGATQRQQQEFVKAQFEEGLKQEGCRVEVRVGPDGEQNYVTVCDTAEQKARLAEFCHAAWLQWLADNPQYAHCIVRSDETAFVAICERWLTGEISFEHGAALWSQYVRSKGCYPEYRKQPETLISSFVNAALAAGAPVQPAGLAEGFMGSLNPFRLFRG